MAGLVIHEARSIPEVGQSFTFHGSPLQGPAPRAQPHYRAAHSAFAANAVGEGRLISATFTGCGCVNRERVHTAGELGCERLINHPMTLDAGLSPERVRHDIDPVVSLPARPVPGMALMLVRFINHFEALRRESLGQTFL